MVQPNKRTVAKIFKLILVMIGGSAVTLLALVGFDPVIRDRLTGSGRESLVGTNTGFLLNYVRNNNKREVNKWRHYLEIYERHLSQFRNKEVTLLEIGVAHGGSLQMWKAYFGPRARIIGIDIDERCKDLEEEQIEILIGDQADRDFLARFRESVPKLDILVDDGGHEMHQQITTFEELFPHISENGVYLCEDLHTSYWPRFGGGYKVEGSFIEMSKDLIDHLTAWHTIGRESLEVSWFTESVDSMHYYDSMLVIEKRPMKWPKEERTGNPSF